MYYTGVGSRKTPQDILRLMQEIAIFLARHGFTLRTGDAVGADSAFAKGAQEVGGSVEIYKAHHATEASMQYASSFHPAWNRMGDYAKKLHGRNVFQVLGLNMQTPSRFLVCWTPDGCLSHQERSIVTGGTGTAISIAQHNGIQVHNLQRNEYRVYWETLIQGGNSS